nr:YeeE/YedE thiosulfate transporter family protein [uncultured Desulfobacter sp.]
MTIFPKTGSARYAGQEKKISKKPNPHLKKFIRPGSLPNWQLMFVIGIGLGAFAAAKLSNDFKWQAVPDMWQEQFGNSSIKRAFVALFGGAVALFGARLAGG